MPRGTRFTAEKMAEILNECKERGTQSAVARKHGISEKTISGWKKKFKGMDTGDIRRAKKLEEENSRLKRIIANLTIDNDALRELNTKKW